SSTIIQTAVNQLGLAIAHTWCAMVLLLLLCLRTFCPPLWHVGCKCHALCKASPTESTLRLEYSHMVDDALEMIAVDRCPKELSEDFTLSISTDAGAQD
ncbi:hypothetical protein EDB85DRAFT_1996301, partial [Lactarius pseudohatsudake]